MVNVLVTGAAGLIGRRLSEMLIEQGHAVTGVVNLNDAYDIRRKEYRLRKMKAPPKFAFQKFDISKHGSVEKLPAFDRIGHPVKWYRTERAWAKEVKTL
jgi:UDP-glucuronate 4-epimerase